MKLSSGVDNITKTRHHVGKEGPDKGADKATGDDCYKGCDYDIDLGFACNK